MNSLQKHALAALAIRCGFDQECEMDDVNWLHFVNTSNGCQVWLSMNNQDEYIVGIEHKSFFEVLMPAYSPAFRDVKPSGAYDCLWVTGMEKLSSLLWTLASADFTALGQNEQVRSTEREVERVEREGQDLYRKALINYWHGKCAVTGLSIERLLRASHIKPWADSNDTERLDVFNGFLLSPNLDLAFDQGFITFDDAGMIQYSSTLDEENATRLGLSKSMRIALDKKHIHYLEWHRQKVFEK